MQANRRHAETQTKYMWEEGEEKAKEKVFEIRFRGGGEENERQKANNVMRGIRVVMGTWYVLT